MSSTWLSPLAVDWTQRRTPEQIPDASRTYDTTGTPPTLNASLVWLLGPCHGLEGGYPVVLRTQEGRRHVP
jgi:hypothetical protein